MSLAELMKQRT